MSKQHYQETAREVGDTRLGPIRHWATANHGAIKRITDWLRARTGEPLNRQTVGRWLTVDPARRQMPHHGWGILLEEAYRELAGGE